MELPGYYMEPPVKAPPVRPDGPFPPDMVRREPDMEPPPQPRAAPPPAPPPPKSRPSSARTNRTEPDLEPGPDSADEMIANAEELLDRVNEFQRDLEFNRVEAYQAEHAGFTAEQWQKMTVNQR